MIRLDMQLKMQTFSVVVRTAATASVVQVAYGSTTLL